MTRLSIPGAATVGQPMARVDGLFKVTGQARYSADHTAADQDADQPLRGLVHAVLVISATSRADANGVDAAAAKAAPGVLDVLTDFSGAKLPFPAGQVNFFGQPLAVGGRHPGTGRARGIPGHYRAPPEQHQSNTRARPAVTEIDDPSAAPRPAPKTPDYQRGDPAAALRFAHTVVDQRYRIARDNHNPMEMPATVARWDGDRLTGFDKTQWVQGTARSLAADLGVPVGNVRVLSPFVGGAFGSAGATWPHQVLAALTARSLNRPVKLVLNRRQMYSGIGYRPTSAQRLALGAGPDGRLAAVLQDARTETSRYQDYEDSVTDLPKFLYQSPNMSARYPGVHPARMIMRARVLLELDENAGPVPDQVVAAARAATSTTTVRVVAKRFAETGGDILATIGRKPRQTPPVAPIVTGDVEARLIKLACSTPPEGFSRWSLRLLERHAALSQDLPDLDHSTRC